MLSFLFASVSSIKAGEVDPCSQYNSSCLLCMQHNEECFYCLQKNPEQSRCISNSLINETTCVHVAKDVDQKCVETLGGDAVNTTRYIIGSVIFTLTVIADCIVRFWPQKKGSDYSHL